MHCEHARSCLPWAMAAPGWAILHLIRHRGLGWVPKHAMSGMQSGQDPSIKPSLHFPLRSRLNSTLRSQSPLSKAIAHTFVAIEGGRLRAQLLGRGAHPVRVPQTFPVLCRLPKAVKRLKSCARSKVMLPGGHRVSWIPIGISSQCSYNKIRI